MGNFVGGGSIVNNENQAGSAVLKNCYYDSDLFTQKVNPSGYPLTTDQMKNSSNYINQDEEGEDWDFTNTWYIDENVNDGYPELKFN